ncbi:unnamed protein product [Phyllotreta striolata]|uniref:Elongator complex protein 6 n=1 Tax=Phyllotreta striolata TaxID=444603 RepID=A0A9N9TN18_PHYSR|nr:unnamed protein product [Phyllotreta striolata]
MSAFRDFLNITRSKMISLGDPVASNAVLSALQVSGDDRIISIKEGSNADSNFVITHLIKQIVHEKNRLCLVNFHNTIDHYQTIGKKLGYDLLKGVEDDSIRMLQPIKELVDNIEQEDKYLQENTENIVKQLYADIRDCLRCLKGDNKLVYLIVDDLSHLHDLGVDVKDTLSFTHYCMNLTDNNDITVVFNNHVSTKTDEILSNNLQYVADVHVEVAALKTGSSRDITGLLTIRRKSAVNHYHYKAYDRGIKTFHPGESIYHLYQ